MLMGSGTTEDAAIADAQSEAERAGLAVEEGSEWETEKVALRDGETPADCLQRHI
jgi:hypothetical protein